MAFDQQRNYARLKKFIVSELIKQHNFRHNSLIKYNVPPDIWSLFVKSKLIFSEQVRFAQFIAVNDIDGGHIWVKPSRTLAVIKWLFCTFNKPDKYFYSKWYWFCRKVYLSHDPVWIYRYQIPMGINDLFGGRSYSYFKALHELIKEPESSYPFIRKRFTRTLGEYRRHKFRY